MGKEQLKTVTISRPHNATAQTFITYFVHLLENKEISVSC